MATRCKEKKKISPEKVKGMKLVCGKCGAYANKEKKLCKPKKNVGSMALWFYGSMVKVFIDCLMHSVSHSLFGIQHSIFNIFMA